MMGKTPKPNPFMMYMQSRRKEFERQGRKFPGGWKEVSDLVKDDWMNMSEDKKAEWKELSKAIKEGQDKDNNNEVPNPLFVPGAADKKDFKVDPVFGFPPNSTSGITKEKNGRPMGKLVIREYAKEDVLLQVKSRFLKLVQDSTRLLESAFCCVHFEYYDEGYWPNTLEPAEYACSRWSIADGIKTFEGSLIDTGHVHKNEKDPRGTRRNEILYIPPPNYNYQRGLGYAAGEDDYDKILKSISDNAVMMTDSGGNKWKYVFTELRHMDTVRECLAWLMYQCDVDLKLRVFPLELVLQELFRCCATIRKLRERGLGHVCETPNVPLDVKLNAEDYEYIMEKGSLENVKASVVGPCYYRMRSWETRLRLGCAWHQKAPNEGGILHCPTNYVKKWSCLALSEAVYLLNLPSGPWLEFLQGDDIRPVPWTERDAMGIEMRQRLGLIPVSQKRRAVLEDKFIFPALLDTLKKKHPYGLTFVPTDIIWPVDRDMDVDLNYSTKPAVIIRDADRSLTLQKRHEKRIRDAEIERKQKQEDYEWMMTPTFEITC